MPWKVEATDEFVEWYGTLAGEQAANVTEVVDLLVEFGPQLKRPYADRIHGSRLHNLKELRCDKQGSLRVLFLFDPRRTAILLLGGDKTGQWTEWYAENIPKAEAIYAQYLRELEEEGLL